MIKKPIYQTNFTRTKTPGERRTVLIDDKTKKPMLDKAGKPMYIPSRTVSGQSLTPSDILERYKHGKSITANMSNVFTGDDEYPNLKAMDIIEITELREKVSKQISEYEKQQEALARIQKKKMEQKLFDDAVEKKANEKIMKKSPPSGDKI